MHVVTKYSLRARTGKNLPPLISLIIFFVTFLLKTVTQREGYGVQIWSQYKNNGTIVPSAQYERVKTGVIVLLNLNFIAR